MKKFFIGIFTMIALLTVKVQGAEIIPEYFLMERLIMLMDVAPTYISNDGKQELKAMQVDKEVMNILGNSENPFYIYDSNNEKKIVRMGDKFVTRDFTESTPFDCNLALSTFKNFSICSLSTDSNKVP